MKDPVQQARLLQSYLVGMQNGSVVFTWWTKRLSHGFCLRNCSLGKISRKGALTPWLTFEGRSTVMLYLFPTQSSLLNLQLHLPAWIPTN